MRRFVGLLVALLVPTWAIAEDAPVYRWLREIDLPEITTATPVGVPLDSHFFQATRDGWPDVRLRDDRNAPMAFLIRAAHDLKTRTVRQSWPAEQLAAKVDADIGLQVDLMLREKEPSPSGVQIITPLRDFEHQVRVEWSDDGRTWAAAGPATLIFDYSQHVDARNVLVPFDADSHRRFRLIIADVTAEQQSQLLELHRRLRGADEVDRTERTAIARRPFRIDRIEFYRDDAKVESSELQTATYPTADFAVTENEQKHQTILTFNTQREPITEIKVLTQAENFSRAATVEAELEDVNGKFKWQPLAQGTLTRFSVGTIQREELKLTIRETHAVHYRVVIENRDSPPLAVAGVELTGPRYELTFLASPHRNMTLEYGSPDAKAGRYDTAALQAALSQGQAVTQAQWQPPRENVNAPTDQGRAWQPWNDPRVLFGGIIALTLLLGWGLFRAGRRLDIPPPTQS